MQNFQALNDYPNNEYYGSTDKSIQYRFLIPQPAAGAIISRNGDTINRMRTQHQCDISLPASASPERVLVINSDIEKLCAILTEIFVLAKDCMHAKVNDPKDIASGCMPDNVISDEIDLRFLVSENVCGAVIGKGGEVIRRLTDTFRISVMKVYQQMCPASTDRVIRLVGLPEDVLNCMRAIHAVILGLKDIKSAREYDPNDFNEFHAVNYGGWVTPDTRRIIGRQGGPPAATKGPTPSGRSQQEYGIVCGGYEPVMPSPVFEGLTLGQMSEKLRSQNIMLELGQETPNCFPPAQRGPPLPRGPIEMSHVSLPNKLIGAIMGKGGSRINDIREESGARIDVEKTPIQAEGEERVITIQGSREQIEKAQYLLQQCVKKYGGRQW